MTSSSTLPSKFFNNLDLNHLQALNSKVSNFNDPTPSYLFSILINNATLNKLSDKATLTFTTTDVLSIIKFTDRPLRQTSTITLDDFTNLFIPDNSGFNSFSEDPPNGVLVNKNEQKTYELKSVAYDGENMVFELLYVGASGELVEFSGKMSFFVDATGKEGQSVNPDYKM